MSPLRACLPLLAVLSAWGAAGAPPEARSGVAARARHLAAAVVVVEARAALPAPGFAGDVLTDARDVRACLPLDGGAVLAATGGGLLLVRADGTTRAPWTALDGLPETRVHAVLRDGDRLWIGTEGGLAAARLHGEELAVEQAFAGKPVRALALHEGALHAAIWGGGVERFDAGKGLLVKLRVAGRGGEERFSALAEHEGVLFAGAASGLYRVEDGEVAKVAGAPAAIWALASHGGRLWMGSSTGLVSLAGGDFRGESDADVRGLASGGGVLLAGTFGQGAVEVEGGRARAVAAFAGEPFVQAVGASSGTRCAGGPAGLFVQRGAAARWEEARVPELASNDVSALAVDGDRLWIGTFDRGLAVLQGGRVSPVRDPALDEKVNAVAVEHAAGGSRVWVATARGLDRIELRGEGRPRVTRYDELAGLASGDVHAVVALASGGVLVGTARGAAIVAEGRVTVLGEKLGVPPGAVWAVAEGPDGTLLLGTSRGLLVGTVESRGVIDHGAPAAEGALAGAPRSWVRLAMATGDLDDDWVTALAVRGRTIYAGTYNAGVTALVMGEGGAFSAEQLGGGYVNMGGLLVAGGTLFAGTMNGLLVRAVAGAGGWRAAPRAAPGRDVTAIAPAGGRFWVASRRGLARFSPGR
jgi:ligand-binding sensor domain-containing protein